MARNNAATLAGLAALGGAAYLYNKKKDEGTDLGSTRKARPDSTETREDVKMTGTPDLPVTPSSKKSKAPAPAPAEASDADNTTSAAYPSGIMGKGSDVPLYKQPGVTIGGQAKRTEGNAPMPSLRAVEARAASNKTDAMRNASRAQQAATNRMRAMAANPEAQAVEAVYPEQYMTPGGGVKTMANMARAAANRGVVGAAERTAPAIKEIGMSSRSAAPAAPQLSAPARQLTGPSKADLVARDRAARAAARQEAMVNENAANYGLNPEAPGYGAAASALRDKLGGADFSLGMKRGGAVKRMASGGMTSKMPSASRRGDGIASRGKTRGKIC